MITSLSTLSLYSFIELLCGKHEVLCEHENESAVDLEKTAKELIYRYNSIVNPSGVEAFLLEKGDLIKAKARVNLAKILKALMSIHAYDEVRILFEELGYKEQTPDAMNLRIDRMLAEAEYIRNRLGTESSHKNANVPEDIRARFDAEVAFLMTYFKMNIDIRVISAGVYANMLRQADVEIKRRMSRK